MVRDVFSSGFRVFSFFLQFILVSRVSPGVIRLEEV